ncbi:MAG TPA: histidine kinase [Actinomycetes bacterium]
MDRDFDFGTAQPSRRQRVYWHVGTLFWIVYLIFDLPGVIRAPQPGSRLALQLALLALVVAAYVYVVVRPPSDTPLPGRGVAILVILAIIVTLVVGRFPGRWIGLLTFVALAVPAAYPRRRAARAVALTVVLTGGLSLWQGLPPSTVSLNCLQTGISGFGMLGFFHIIGLNVRLRRAQDELARMAVADERLRFSRDLHDLLGHSLSVIVLKSELAGGLLETDPVRAATEVREIEQVARRSLAEVREAVGGYRRVALAAELAGARAALDAAGVRATVEEPPRDLPEPVQEALGWAVREGTTNVLRHSGAATCRVGFERDGDRVAVVIADDGAGADPLRRGSPSGGNGSGGSGLAGLAERVAGSGGRLQAGPRPEGGFQLRVEVPAG